jgi:hypothetical protein
MDDHMPIANGGYRQFLKPGLVELLPNFFGLIGGMQRVVEVALQYGWLRRRMLTDQCFNHFGSVGSAQIHDKDRCTRFAMALYCLPKYLRVR